MANEERASVGQEDGHHVVGGMSHQRGRAPRRQVEAHDVPGALAWRVVEEHVTAVWRHRDEEWLDGAEVIQDVHAADGQFHHLQQESEAGVGRHDEHTPAVRHPRDRADCLQIACGDHDLWRATGRPCDSQLAAPSVVFPRVGRDLPIRGQQETAPGAFALQVAAVREEPFIAPRGEVMAPRDTIAVSGCEVASVDRDRGRRVGVGDRQLAQGERLRLGRGTPVAAKGIDATAGLRCERVPRKATDQLRRGRHRRPWTGRAARGTGRARRGLVRPPRSRCSLRPRRSTATLRRSRRGCPSASAHAATPPTPLPASRAPERARRPGPPSRPAAHTRRRGTRPHVGQVS